MPRSRTLLKTVLVTASTALALTGFAAPAQANGVVVIHPPKPYNYVCTNNSGQAQDWNGKDPYTCVGVLNVYDANGRELINVKNGAKSDEPVDCTGQDANGMLTIFTRSEVLGTGVAEYVWSDSWIETFNCLAT